MPEVRPEVKAAVAEFVRSLEENKIRVERVYVFGSYLHGVPDEWSDIDLIVVSPDFGQLGFWEQTEIISESARRTFAATGKAVEARAKTPDDVAKCHPASFLADMLKGAALVYDAATVGRKS